MPIAFTRAVSPKLADCEITHIHRAPIDQSKAAEQHANYEAALSQAGLKIVRLPELPDHPDAVFVEDTALLLGDHAVILRPGAASRAAETQSTESILEDEFELLRLNDGHVDGGDVLRINQTLYVGASTRSNDAGIEALREAVAPIGFEVKRADLNGCLHLKTAATMIGPDRNGEQILLYSAESLDPSQIDGVVPLAVDPGEAGAANCLRIGDQLIMPAGYPRTAQALRNRGFDLVEVDISELEKAEAGLTCLSLIAD